MQVFDMAEQERFDSVRHVEKVLGRVGEGDVSIACWQAGQTSPYHCHPEATEIYFCISGGGVMRTPAGEVAVGAGCFVVHPRGEMHEFVNGPERTVLFRVRYGDDMHSRTVSWNANPAWQPRPEDRAYFGAAGGTGSARSASPGDTPPASSGGVSFAALLQLRGLLGFG